MGTSFWGGLIDWLKDSMLSRGNIAEKDLDLFRLTDDPDEAADLIAGFYKKHRMQPNF